tara:strand:+ start:182 stop:355 length:174 start_codon:yes stop_codon:yes gene_type:complete
MSFCKYFDTKYKIKKVYEKFTIEGPKNIDIKKNENINNIINLLRLKKFSNLYNIHLL